MPLTDVKIKSARPTEKPYKLYDERGLFLIVTPTGGKWWRLKYRFDDKEKLLSLGVYPDIGLRDARDRRDEARKLLTHFIDRGLHRQTQKMLRQAQAANSFEAVAREWHAEYAPTWAEHHGDRIIRRLERDVFPWIGKKAIAEISAPEVLAAARRIERRGALETAHRALANCGQVFRYAVATGRALRDPTGDLRGALPPVRVAHFSAVTEPGKVANLLGALDGYEGSLIVSCALRLAPLVFVRPGELRTAKSRS
ncbi:integrase arm-type DNA-binding domain-containing protein [Duganella sp. CF517]|uniref:tyrosine-type recombinase/integrase n=1 Tax=Duganella sp. CF517 TaxID=1881038 RepID=UPI000B7DB170|nr:integrase arm-type DNA-binding domain-containing protein [Duganella sp. CF517]